VVELKEDHKANCKYWLKFIKEKFGTSEFKMGATAVSAVTK